MPTIVKIVNFKTEKPSDNFIQVDQKTSAIPAKIK